VSSFLISRSSKPEHEYMTYKGSRGKFTPIADKTNWFCTESLKGVMVPDLKVKSTRTWLRRDQEASLHLSPIRPTRSAWRSWRVFRVYTHTYCAILSRLCIPVTRLLSQVLKQHTAASFGIYLASLYLLACIWA
jgi:hypothetical protein